MNKHNISILFLFAMLLSVAITSCEKPRPKNVLPEDKMRAIMIDLYLLDGSASVKQIPVGDTVKVAYYNAILKKQGVTLAQYDSSTVWYAKHIEILQKLHQQVVDSLTARGAALDKVK